MSKHPAPPAVCGICGQPKRAFELLSGQMVREVVRAEVVSDFPDWTAAQPICLTCLNRYRAKHVGRLLEQEKGELTAMENEVVRSLEEQASISENIHQEFESQLTWGQRLSDGMARFGGSWTFILLFFMLLVGWIALNSSFLLSHAYDPFPFILLNLVLSCLAAIQAPVILMSQNRQEAKDRLRAENDYRVNLKSEMEIRLLHAKLDQLLTHQWQRLLEIQQLQLDLMEDLSAQGTASQTRPSRPKEE